MLPRSLIVEFFSIQWRYNTLKELFEQLESNSIETIQLCDQRRMEIERLENEVEVWRDKAESFELQIKKNTEEFKWVRNAIVRGP